MEWWSWILTAITCTGLWLAGTPRTRPIGWGVALANEVLWLVYAITTQQYGFIIGAGVYGIVYARNLWQAHVERD